MRGSARSTCRLTVDQLMAQQEREPRATVGGAMRYLLNCSDEERAHALARVDAARAVELEEREAEKRRPRSLVGREAGAIISLRVVQHEQRENSMLISMDGNSSKAKWVPITGKPPKPGKPGKTITTVYFTARAWEPGQLGFLIVLIPGWLASDRAFTKCENPQLSPDVTWTTADTAAWEALADKVAKDRRDQSKAEKATDKWWARQQYVDEERRERRAERNRTQASS